MVDLDPRDSFRKHFASSPKFLTCQVCAGLARTEAGRVPGTGQALGEDAGRVTSVDTVASQRSV